MKKITIILFAAILFAACSNSKNVTIFEIGDSRDMVINTLANEFTVFCGEKWTEDQFKDREIVSRDNYGLRKFVTLYECMYKGQEYYKIRIYFSYDRVCKMEFIVEQDKMKDLHKKLKSKYGTPQRTTTPRNEIATVYFGDIDGVFVTEDSRTIVHEPSDGQTTEKECAVYEITVVSGGQLAELKKWMS